MRLSAEQINNLKSTLFSLSHEASLFLFGSRVDDNKKGGDIDLLVISSSLKHKDLRKLRIEFFKEFGEQKIDIVLANESSSDPFVKLVRQTAIQL